MVQSIYTRRIRVLLLGTLMLLVSSVIALSWVPPNSRDALAHHLAVPKLYLSHGGLYEIPFMPFSYYPMNLELLYLIPLYFGNDIVPKLIHFTFALLTAWLIYVYIRRRMDDIYGLLGIVLFLSIPIVVRLSTIVYVDLGLVFFSTASLLFLLRWIEKGFKTETLILSAVFCGLAMGTKYNGLVTACLLVLFIPFLYSRHTKGAESASFKPIAQALVFLSIAMALFSPWMARNYAWKKNPVYPLYDGWFRNLSEREEANGGAHKAQSWSSVGLFTKRRLLYKEAWWEIALIPIRVFIQGQDGDPQYFDGRMNPFLLILPLFAFLGHKRDPPLVRYEKWTLLAFAGLYFSIVFFTREMRIRYIAPVIPPLVLLSAYGVRNVVREIGNLPNPRLRFTGLLIFCSGLIFFAGINIQYLVSQFRSVDPAGYITGQVNREEYLERRIHEYPALKYMNAHLPLHSRTLFLFLGNRGYYCDRPYVLDRGNLYGFIKKSSQPEQILQRLWERGITHLLIRYDLFDKWKKDKYIFSHKESSVLNQFMMHYAKPLFFKRGYGVFVLKGRPDIKGEAP